MTWTTKRRLRRTCDALREERDKARRDLVKAAEEHDNHVRQLGRKIAEIETHKTNLAAQLDIAHAGLAHAKKAMAELGSVDLVKRGAE